MKTKTIVILICMLLFCGVVVFNFTICKKSYEKNKNQSEEILKMAHELVDIQSEETNKENLENVDDKSMEKSENDVIGILYIPKLNLEAPVKEGTTQEVMKTSVGHFVESDFWNGNVSLASHNSGTSMHYFQDLHKLQINDEIKYKTQLGEKVYKVQSVEKISDTDWSKVVGNNNDANNTITLITCINGQPDYRLCVRGIEKGV